MCVYVCVWYKHRISKGESQSFEPKLINNEKVNVPTLETIQ